MIGPNKAIAAGTVGAGVTIIVFILGQFNINVPPEVSSAAVAFLSTVATWLVPHGGVETPAS